MKLQYRVSDTFDKESRKEVGAFLSKFNMEALKGHVWGKNIEIIVKDESGEIVGGLYGNSHWSWMFVDWLVIREDARGQGVGKELMRLCELECKKRDIHRIRLNTFEFQAPDFYQKIGFEIVAIEEGFPPDSRTYYMQKYLDKDNV